MGDDTKKKKFVRAVKFEVVFPGLRQSDRPALYKRLWTLQDELTRAANRLASALFQVRLGTLPWPRRTKGGVEGPVPFRSLAYKAIGSLNWMPFGPDDALYKPSESAAAGSMVLLDLASLVHTRVSEDFVDICRGDAALSTFRRQRQGGAAIGIAGNGIKVMPNGTILLSLWEGGGKPVTIRPRKIDGGQAAVLRKVLSGEVDHGSGKLWFDKRSPEARGKWMFSLSWSSAAPEVPVSEAPMIAGAHLGITNTVSMAYATLAGEVQRFSDRVQFPESTVRAWNRLHQERRARSAFNRTEYGLREGHGRVRKLRVVEPLSDKVHRMTTTTARQTASAVVNNALRRGCVGIVWEDLHNWSVGTAHADADDMSRKNAAAHRRWYFQWHQGMLRECIQQAAEREGLWFEVVSATNDSRTCSSCGTVWKDTGVYRPKGVKASSSEHGRLEWDKWSCSCGLKVHADRNAAINVCRRGVASFQTAQAAK